MPKLIADMKNIYGIIDVGTQQIRVLIGQRDERDGRVSVLGAGIVPAEGIDERGVAHIERAVASIERALQQAMQQSGTVLRRVWVALHHVELRGEWSQGVITFPQPDHEIQYEDLERLRQQAAQRPVPADMELIHVVPQTYHLDHRRDVRDPIGMSGVRLEGQFYLLYAPQTVLHTLRRCFQRIGVEVEGFVSRALLAAEVFLSPGHKASGVGLVYMGTHATTVVLYAQGVLRHFAVLPLGGYRVTQDIREVLRFILPQQAEVLKIQQGVALASLVDPEEILRLRLPGVPEPVEVRRRFLSEIIQARLEEIFVFVAREIEKAGLLKQLYGGIYLAGGGAAMPNIEKLVEYVLGERAFHVAVDEIIGRGIVDPLRHPQMAGAVATLWLVPTLREFLPPLPPPPEYKTTAKEPAAPTPSKLMERLRSMLEKSFKLPQDLIE